MENKLTGKQRRFCEEYCIDLNATQAAIRAGYSKATAGVIACENLKKSYLVDYIKKIEPAFIKKNKAIKKEKINNNNGYVYLINCIGTNLYKIGMTSRTPKARLSSLQTSIPFDLRLAYSINVDNCLSLEAKLHKELNANRHRGEWFIFNDLEKDLVIEMMRCYE